MEIVFNILMVLVFEFDGLVFYIVFIYEFLICVLSFLEEEIGVD